MSARRDGQTHHLLDGFDPDQTIRDSGDVVEPIPVGRDHRILPVLGDLLHAAMQESDVAIKINDGLAIEPQDDTQHAVRRRVLRPHVENHLRAIEQRLSGCRDLYLMHWNCKDEGGRMKDESANSNLNSYSFIIYSSALLSPPPFFL